MFLIQFRISNELEITVQIVITLEIYGVRNIVGIPFGYRGFSDNDLSEMPVSSCLIFFNGKPFEV